jgi:prepilin-type N-terminal cleavage/methylation domain-containing protein
MKYKNTGFTFVELIVVITILAILATIGFWTYQWYLAWGRDTNRLVQLNDIHDGLELYSINSRLPFPEDMIEIQANGETFAYQGYAWEWVIQAIGYDGGWKDTEYGTYLTFMLWMDQRSFQLMTYIDDSQLLSDTIISSSYANQDYTAMYPKVLGAPLWVLVEDITNAPLQEIDAISTTWLFDVVTGSGEIISYFTDTNKITTRKGEDISMIIPDKSCARIKELWRWKWSGEYSISPTWSSKKRVYCDMETDGWGWTFGWYIDESGRSNNLFFATWTWNYHSDRRDDWNTYLFPMGDLGHTEMMILTDTNNVTQAEKDNDILFLKYGLDADQFHNDYDINNCGNKFWIQDGFFHKSSSVEEYLFSSVWDCGWTAWSLRPLIYNPGGLYMVRIYNSGVGGAWFLWRPSVDNDQWWSHDAWIFVR